MWEHPAAAPLGYDDFYQLGLTAQRSGDYGLAAEWLSLSAAAPEGSIYRPDVLVELAQTHYFVSTRVVSAERYCRSEFQAGTTE